MILQSIASHFPHQSFTQKECLTAMQEADFWAGLEVRSRILLQRVLEGDSGIKKRHFALDKLESAWLRDAEQLNNTYEVEAPRLAGAAVEKALKKAGLSFKEVDALFVCSCTGALCPGLSSHVAEQLGLRADIFMQDLTGFGCGATVPMLRAADGFIAQNPDAVIVTVAVEVCSAAFYVEDDFGVLISTCLFGDGAAAAVWSGRGAGLELSNYQSLHFPEEREKIRFTNAGGKLRNQLDKSVPQLAAGVVEQLYEKRQLENPKFFATHGGGRDVIEHLESVLPVEQLSYARDVMQQYGNLSSPSCLVALELLLAKEPNADEIWLCGFGAGFSAHSCELRRVR